MRHSTVYTLIFAAIICVVCGIMVSSAAVTLKDAQDINAELDKQKNVLQAAGLVGAKEKLTPEELRTRFAAVETVAYDLETGAEDPSFELEGYDQLAASKDPALSIEAPPNLASVQRIPKEAQVFKVNDEAGNLEMVILPIEGLGLWGTLYGFIAVDPTSNEVRGITYYTHKETPGLGGEVDNPRWKALWPGRKVFGADGSVELQVIKGQAGPAAEAPYKVDGLSGATITSRGVTNMIHFWLGPDAFGPYIEQLKQQQKAA
jgi:Na+-transporting NADH:ubiquinone oxidoreductase subunit C